jgi:hypothetical protein
MTTYPLSDHPNQTEWKELGSPKDITQIVAIRTGEFRPPKKGEWYLSGAIPEAYRAYSNLGNKFHIVKLVKKENKIDKRELISKLYSALGDYHRGTSTTRPLNITYKRNEEILREAKEFLVNTE